MRTIPALWQQSVSSGPSEPAFLVRGSDGVWSEVSFAEAGRRVEELAAGLVAIGVGHGDRVAIIGRTRLEWTLCDYALASVGAISVPVYPTSSAAETLHVLADAGVSLVLCEDREQYAKAVQARGSVPGLGDVFVFDGEPGSARPLSELEAAGRDLLASRPDAVDERRTAVGEDDVLTIIYTSGTTGPQKGCVLRQRNFWEMTGMIAGVSGLFSGRDRVLLYLPLAHNFARLVQFVSARLGLTLAFCPDVSLVADALREVRPTIFPSVPRVFEKVHTAVSTQIAEAPGPRRLLGERALTVGERAWRCRAEGGRLAPWSALEHRLLDALVGRRVRARLGGELRVAISGGAPLSPEVAGFFAALGLTILEGYGLTECTTASHLNRPGSARFGTVGQPLPGIEAAIAGDGEVLLRGPTLFAGYHGDPAATAEAIDSDGWLRTGDVGSIDENGFLTITDRKKDIIITSGGKNLSPQNIEQALCASPYVSQALVLGDRRPFVTALIVPEGAPGPVGDRARAGIEQAVAGVNRTLGRTEQVKRFAVLDRPFSPDLGEVTPTLKLRRHVCLEHFAEVVDSLYADG